MRSKLLSAVVALSLLAVVFCALPTKAAVYYTGSVETTDNTGTPKDVYFQGERVYVSVNVSYLGEWWDGYITVELWEADGDLVSWFSAYADQPVPGQLDSWLTPANWLNTGGVDIYGDYAVADVVASAGAYEFARTQIKVLEEGLFLDPPPMNLGLGYGLYYPGEDITVTVVTRHTEDFYIEVANETYGDKIINETNLEVVDGIWSGLFTIPSDAPDGWYILNVRAEADHTIWFSTGWFRIQAYFLEVQADRYYYLPGEVAELNYRVVDITTFDIHEAVTIEWNATYTNESGNATYEWGTFTGGSGIALYDIPTDIAWYSDVIIHLYANDTQGRSAEAWVDLGLGLLGAEVEIDYIWYNPGDTVEMTVWAYLGMLWYSWDWLSDVEVDISVTKDDVEIAAYGADNLMTDLMGEVYHSFDLATSADLGTYLVTVNVSKLGYDVTIMDTFEVTWEADFSVSLDKSIYYSGQMATISFEVTKNGMSVSGYPIVYEVYLDDGATLLAIGNSNGSDVMVGIPSNYVGSLEVFSAVNIDGYVYMDDDDAWVSFALVVVSATGNAYRPGETVTFYYEILTGISTGMLEYTVDDDIGEEVASGTLPFALSGTFEFVVPDEDVSGYYVGTLKMEDGTGRKATGSDTIWLYSNYELRITLETDSAYASGDYAPGDVLKFSYEILVYGEDADVSVFMIIFGSWLDDVYQSIIVTELTGEFEYTIPETAGNAEAELWAGLYNALGGGALSSDEIAFETDASLSSWDRSVGGMSMINFLILLLIVIMIILLIIVPFLKGRAGKPKAEKAFEPEPPAAAVEEPEVETPKK